MMSNNDRADLGAEAVMAAAALTNVHSQEGTETAITDVLSYIAHLCDRCDLDPQSTFTAGLHSYMGDEADGPFVSAAWDPKARLVDHWPAPTVPVVVVTRHPDFENHYQTFGHVKTYDIDMGRSNLKDPDELASWRESHRIGAQEFRDAGQPAVAEHIETTINEVEV